MFAILSRLPITFRRWPLIFVIELSYTVKEFLFLMNSTLKKRSTICLVKGEGFSPMLTVFTFYINPLVSLCSMIHCSELKSRFSISFWWGETLSGLFLILVISLLLHYRVPLANGGSLVIEQTEALVSVDVNGGHGMFGQGTSQEKAILEVNLAAAKQV